MRKIDSIILHCTATPEGNDYTVDTIRGWHKQRGFNDIGYHYVIHLDGTVSNGRPVNLVGAHALGWNANSIGIVYVGGLDKSANKGKDTRTPEQKEAFKNLIAKLVLEHKDIRILLGHRDTSPDLNGNGTVERGEWIKECPCFDTEVEYGKWFNDLLKSQNVSEEEINKAINDMKEKRKKKQ